MRRSLAISLALLAACVDKGPGPTQKQIDPGYVQKNLLAEPPAQMTNAVNANLGGKVVYLGNDVDGDTVSAGDKVKIVHYWKVVAPPGDGWRVFTHVLGAARGDWLNVDVTDMRTGYGPEKWRAGDIIRDEQTFILPERWSSPYAQIVLGLFPRGGKTAKDRLPVIEGPADSESRVLAVRFKVERKAERPPAPPYVIRKARGPITMDGRADEADWKSAPESPEFPVAEGSPGMDGATRARMLWDDQHLYVFVSSEDGDVFSSYRNHDDPLWKEDVVELFIDADRSRRGYVELQVNPNNAQFDSWFETTRAAKGDETWNAGMITAVTVRGTADSRGDRDSGWDAELAIPLAAVKGRDQAMAVTIPPAPGTVWRLNVVRIDKNGDKPIAVSSWNRITYQDFHALGRMLEATFGDENGNTPAATPAPAPAGAQPAQPGAQPAQPGAQPAQPGAQPAQPGAQQGSAQESSGGVPPQPE